MKKLTLLSLAAAGLMTSVALPVLAQDAGPGAAPAPMVDPAAGFMSQDTDGDGMVSREELAAGMMSGMAATVDTDGDGMISRAELLQVTMSQRFAAARDAAAFAAGIAPGEGSQAGAVPAEIDTAALEAEVEAYVDSQFETFDEDGDDMIAVTDYFTPPADMIDAFFGSMDADGDGKISREEFLASQAAMSSPQPPAE